MPVRDKNVGPPKTCVANPINAANGNKYHHEAVYRGSGPFPLSFDLRYNSLEQPADPQGRPLAKGWRHSYQRSISLLNAASPTETALAWREDGRILYFEKMGDVYVSDAEVSDRLERLVDPEGKFAGWRLVTARAEEVERYDVNGRLQSISNRAGMAVTLSYSGLDTPPATAPQQGLLIRIEDAFGRSLSLRYDAAGRIGAVADPAGTETQLAFDGLGNLVTLTFPGLRSKTFHFESAALPAALTGITDENGARYATYAYDLQGRAILSEHAAGAERTELSFPDSGATAVTTFVSRSLSSTRTYGFEQRHGAFRNSSVSGPGCASCQHAEQTHDANGNPQSVRDWNGNLTIHQYDLARNLETSRTEASGSPEARTVTTEWHPTFRLPTRITKPKRETTMSYDAVKGTLLSRTVRDTASNATRNWTYTYNANGQVLTVDGPRTDVSDVTSYTYYPNDDPDLGKRGNVATITNALGHVTQITAYNAHGQPLAIVDPNGLTTQLAYDARQRLTSRHVGGEVTSYEFDGVGQLTRVTLPDGSSLSYTYDPAHRLTGISDSLGNRIAYTLDLMGNRTKEEVFDPANALAQTRSRVYSSLNRLAQELGAQSQTTSYAYDNQGNVTGITDPLNRVTANAYDALNRLKQMTDPAAGVARYGYDGLDQLTALTDPRNNATTYTVDGLGNLTQQVSPDTGATTNTQDAAGNVVSSTDAKGQTTTSTYDALNRLTRLVYTAATGSQLKQVDYTYDQGANGIGRLITITETSAAGTVLQTTGYGYDPRGRVTSEARTIGGVIATTTYAYDAAGRMTGMTYPSGRTMTYSFDALGRVSRIETSGGGTSQVLLQDVAYQPFGPVKSFTFGNLQPYARSFDLNGRITTHSLANQTKTLAFDAASRITRIEQQGQPANFADYGYDALDRLTSTILPASTFGFSYDPVGNRLSKSTPSGTDTYAIIPTSNRLSSITGATAKTYTHDPNGSITADGVNGFAYDPRGRLVASTSAVGATTYQVNALGQRVKKTSSLGDVVFHYDTQGRLIAESSATGSPIREYLWLGDQPVGVAVYTAGENCPSAPTVDTSRTFTAFERRERMEVRSGRPGERGWEWGLGTNTRDFEASARSDLDWVSGKPYAFTLTYDGVGNARVVVRDSTAELFNLTWTGGMDAGNALRFVVRAPEGIGAGNRIALALTSVDGVPVADTLVTAGDDSASQASRVYAGASLRDGYTVEGTVTFTFTGGYPPRGSRLDLTVTAGNVTCQGQSTGSTATLYYVHADHLNTPRAVADQAQQLVWRWENQEPFGNSPPEENPSGIGSFEFNLRFPGQYFDKETGLHYNVMRDYDPGTGRYVQSDPIGLAGGINPYLYVEGIPLSHVDPRGLLAGRWHQLLTYEGVSEAGLEPWVAQEVANQSVLADWMPQGTQSPINAPWHAMRHPLLTVEEGERAYRRFLDEQIQSCTLRGLGRAIHAAQDSAARGHRGFQPWTGGTPSWQHFQGDLNPTADELALARQRTREIVERYQRACGCAY